MEPNLNKLFQQYINQEQMFNNINQNGVQNTYSDIIQKLVSIFKDTQNLQFQQKQFSKYPDILMNVSQQLETLEEKLIGYVLIQIYLETTYQMQIKPNKLFAPAWIKYIAERSQKLVSELNQLNSLLSPNKNLNPPALTDGIKKLENKIYKFTLLLNYFQNRNMQQHNNYNPTFDNGQDLNRIKSDKNLNKLSPHKAIHQVDNKPDDILNLAEDNLNKLIEITGLSRQFILSRLSMINVNQNKLATLNNTTLSEISTFIALSQSHLTKLSENELATIISKYNSLDIINRQLIQIGKNVILNNKLDELPEHRINTIRGSRLGGFR